MYTKLAKICFWEITFSWKLQISDIRHPFWARMVMGYFELSLERWITWLQSCMLGNLTMVSRSISSPPPSFSSWWWQLIHRSLMQNLTTHSTNVSSEIDATSSGVRTAKIKLVARTSSHRSWRIYSPACFKWSPRIVHPFQKSRHIPGCRKACWVRA